ncbi:nitrous oxide-stimulated promoter family protein [Treponema medium]|nr:nitrous oxide-stimulated promoter family protein [Treponema medium]QSH92194.1 nitrous oxide-stimulated promoter family protein [Treponema medium]
MHKMAIEDEIRLVDSMIDLYAAAHRHDLSKSDSKVIETAVPDAEALKAYTHKRIEQCRYRGKQEKPFCNVCPVHCYKPEMRQQIRAVMRYSGPRMLFRHPILSMQHLIGTIRSKKEAKDTEMKTTEQEHLPVTGVGPVCVAIMIAFTVAGIAAIKFDIFTSGDIHSAIIAIIFIIAGILCIAGGIVLWCAAVFGSRIDTKIKANQLATDGVYALVRNPIYSAFLFICTGALLFCRNWYVLMLPPLFWLYLTIFMKLTEEQWLAERFGDEYTAYCKRVNRFIPWKK